MKKLMFIGILLAIVGKMQGDNLNVADLQLKAGEEKQIAIELVNPENKYVAFQFDLTLPDGITIALNKKGKLNASLVEDRIDDHTLSVEDLTGGKYRFLSFSLTNAEFYESEGPLVNVTLKAADNATAGALTAKIDAQVFTHQNGTQYNLDDMTFKITVESAIVPNVKADDKTRQYGEANPEFTYTVTEGELTGTPTLTTTASQTSPVGTYTIKVEKGTISGDYTATDGTLTITKAPLTITAKDYTIKQGDALPTFEAEYAGFKNSETSAVLTKQPTITTSATSASEPGEYDIIVSGAEAQNYELNYVKGKLTIIQADPVTVTAKSYTIKYGDALPSFEFTSDGAALEGTPSITCEATSASPVGTYPIVISKGSVANYNVTYVNGTLTIEKAPLRITAKDYTIKQGEALPAFEATYEGFKNNETSDVLTKQPVITTTATLASEPGEYEITVSGAEAQNYEMSYIAGKLTIEEQPIDLTFSAGQQWQTFISGTPCKLSKDSNAKVYAVTNIDNENVYIEECLNGIPANCMVLVGLVSKPEEPNTVMFDYCDQTSSISTLLMGGVSETTGLTPYSTYVLYNDEFVLNSGTSVAAGKGYLAKPSNEARHYLDIVIDGGATSVQNLTRLPNHTDTWFDLQGRKLSGYPTKNGIYLNNSKKIVIK